MATSTDSAGLAIATLQQPATLREGVVNRLRAAIVSGELKPGTLLKDVELAAQLGLSATPVREALVQLAGEGLIEIEPNRLKRVTPIDLNAMVELFEVQSRLWALGYAWGAPRIGSAELGQLRCACADHAIALERGDSSAILPAAHAFHRVLMEASGNRELVRVAVDRLPLIQRFVQLCAPELMSAEGLAQHREILTVLERGDALAAIALYEETSGVLVAVAKALREKTHNEETK
ncbi:GntR family transcriptional regulator [Pseudomonas sp. LB3P14]